MSIQVLVNSAHEPVGYVNSVEEAQAIVDVANEHRAKRDKETNLRREMQRKMREAKVRSSHPGPEPIGVTPEVMAKYQIELYQFNQYLELCVKQRKSVEEANVLLRKNIVNDVKLTVIDDRLCSIFDFEDISEIKLVKVNGVVRVQDA